MGNPMADLGALGLVVVGLLLAVAAFVIVDAVHRRHAQRAVVDAVHHGHAVYVARAGLVREDASCRDDIDARERGQLAELADLPALAGPDRSLRLVWSRPKIRDPSGAHEPFDPPIDRRRDAGGSS